MGWGGLGRGACQRSLYFVHYSLLCCRDLWDRCYVTCHHAAEISGVVATWHDSTLLMGWGGVGGHVNAPCTSYIIVCYAAKICGIVATLVVTTLLLRCWDLWDRCYVTCCYTAEISGIVATLLVTTLLRSLGSLRSLAMEMHSQECWLPAGNGACVAAWWRWKAKKRASFFFRFLNHQIGTALW